MKGMYHVIVQNKRLRYEFLQRGWEIVLGLKYSVSANAVLWRN